MLTFNKKMKRLQPVWITLSLLAILILGPSSCRVMIEPDGVVQSSHLKCIWRGFFIGPFEYLANLYTAHSTVDPVNIWEVVIASTILLCLIFAPVFKKSGTLQFLSIFGVIGWVLMGISAAMAWI